MRLKKPMERQRNCSIYTELLLLKHKTFLNIIGLKMKSEERNIWKEGYWHEKKY